MRRALRWLKRIVIGTLVLTVVVVAVALVVVHTDWGRDLIKRRVEAALAKFFPGGLTIERIDGSPLGDLEITGVKIGHVNKHTSFAVGKITANLALTSLLSKEVELEKLVLEH